MVKKTTACFNCEYHRDRADRFQKIIIGIIKSISKSDLVDILVTKKILKKDYLTNEILLKEKCHCGKKAIGYTGLTTEHQKPICQTCFNKLDSELDGKVKKSKKGWGISYGYKDSKSEVNNG